MLRGRLWGRRKWLWIADVLLVALCLVALVPDSGSVRWVFVGIVALRVVNASFLVFVWRVSQGRASCDARDEGVVPPR